VVAVFQARMRSTRLPNKLLLDLCGKPLLLRVVERIRGARTVDQIVIATTTAPGDGVLLDFARRHGLASYAGSEEDVLDRFHQAARTFGAGVIVRITTDDPFKDPGVTDQFVRHLLERPGLDYVSNTIQPTYPEGIDTEVFTFAALEKAWREARLPSEREHVTPYIWKNPGKFRIENLRHDEDLSAWRWTLDYEQDVDFARKVYEALDADGLFSMDEIVRFLRAHPEVAAINSNVVRYQGYAKSLREDEEFLKKGKDRP
jgi:spore coat polysaccharide biosynthesis protein SpsF